jgi:beta-lactamase superfamily II metal-dependent hydrolase
MQLEIFDVEHGACALLTTDHATRMLIDCGHNATTGLTPRKVLQQRGVQVLEMMAVTNYDEDHVSALLDLRQYIAIQSLWRNSSVSADAIAKLKTQDGMGQGIEALVDMARTYTEPLPASVVFPGVARQEFYNTPADFDDENNLSLVIHLTINGVGFLFPGDLECAGWLKLLQRPQFCEAVKSTSVLVASHHGRVSGICDQVFKDAGCNPFFVIISDKGYMYDTQETVPYYRSKARGGMFRNELRHVLTTRKDGHITFRFDQGTWWPA